MSSEELTVGELVRYYREGWRAGHVEQILTNAVYVRPIPPRKGAKIRAVMVPPEDVQKLK